jgi:hypothetical protein
VVEDLLWICLPNVGVGLMGWCGARLISSLAVPRLGYRPGFSTASRRGPQQTAAGTSATMMDDHHAVFSVPEAKALANILRTRGYFHRGTVPWSSQDASVFDSGGTPAVDPSRPPWIVETVHGLCTIDRLRRDLEALVLVHHGRVTVEETTRHLGIDGTLLQTRVLLQSRDSGDPPADEDFGPSSRYVLFGNEIIARQHLLDQVDKLIEDLVKADDAVDADAVTTTPLAVTTMADTILRVPFETALNLIQERLLHHKDAGQKVVVTLRRSDAGTWLLVTARYWSRLRHDLETALMTTTERPIALSELAQERSWELGWLREIIAAEKKKRGEKGTGTTTPFWEDRGDFCGDVFTPRQFQIAQQHLVREWYHTNGYISAHMCRATLQVNATAMKQYLLFHNKEKNGDDDDDKVAAAGDAIVLTNSVVHRAQVAEPLAEAIRDCIDASSWLNLKSLVPIELLEYHPNDVHELLAHISPDPSEYQVWMGDDASALLFSRKLIDSFRTNVIPDVIQRLARARCQELTTTATTLRRESSGITSASGSNNTSKSAKEKHREREAARSSSAQGDTTRDVLDVGPLDGSQIVPALKAIHPDLEELGDDEVILRRACEDAFCTDEANDQYKRSVLKIMDQLVLRHKRVLASSADGGDAVLLSSESGIASLCHLIQARAKFLDHASARPETMSLLRLALLETSCREFVLRITHAAMVRENVSVDDFGLPATQEPVDLSCVTSIPFGSFWTTSGKLDHRVLKSMTDQLSSAVAPLLLELWKTIDAAAIEAEGSASAIGSFLQTANDVCLPISGMPFSKLDRKAEKRLLGLREKHLQTQLFKTSQLDEAVDICISLLYQQVKNVVVFPHSSCRSDVLSMLSNERKAPSERIETLKHIAEVMSQGDPVAHLEAVREICF